MERNTTPHIIKNDTYFNDTNKMTKYDWYLCLDKYEKDEKAVIEIIAFKINLKALK